MFLKGASSQGNLLHEGCQVFFYFFRVLTKKSGNFSFLPDRTGPSRWLYSSKSSGGEGLLLLFQLTGHRFSGSFHRFWISEVETSDCRQVVF